MRTKRTHDDSRQLLGVRCWLLLRPSCRVALPYALTLSVRACWCLMKLQTRVATSATYTSTSRKRECRWLASFDGLPCLLTCTWSCTILLGILWPIRR